MKSTALGAENIIFISDAHENSTMKNYKKYGIRMCTIRHCVIVWVLTEIPEKMLTEFIILKRGLLKRNVYMKDGRQAVA